jgi:hypothetical protein
VTVGFIHGQSAYEPESGTRWTTWGTVSSGFREIEIGWDRLESVGVLAPFLPHTDRSTKGGKTKGLPGGGQSGRATRPESCVGTP